MGEEADALNDIYSDYGAGEAMLIKEVERMNVLWDKAKAAKIDTKILCPTCERTHKKTTYHKIFCSNRKTKGRNNCKDRYWNKKRYFEHV